MSLKFDIARCILFGPIVLTGILFFDNAWAQGSIFGQVRRADQSVPPDGAIELIGFIRDTDDEIHIETCIGVGYEGGNWFDDFQNYLDEAVGVPYHYYFFDRAVSQMGLINKTVPNNSFQEENVALVSFPFPEPPQHASALLQGDGSIRVEWDSVSGVTWHVYRRTGVSLGSFFRIDNPLGNRLDSGVEQPYYLDVNVDSGECYSYVIIAESTPGNYSPASDIAKIDLSVCCIGHVGDINGRDGDKPTLGDIVLLIDHLYISYTDPVCMTEADVNQSGGLNPVRKDITLSDIVILIDHLFINYTPLHFCSDAGK